MLKVTHNGANGHPMSTRGPRLAVTQVDPSLGSTLTKVEGQGFTVTTNVRNTGNQTGNALLEVKTVGGSLIADNAPQIPVPAGQTVVVSLSGGRLLPQGSHGLVVTVVEFNPVTLVPREVAQEYWTFVVTAPPGPRLEIVGSPVVS